MKRTPRAAKIAVVSVLWILCGLPGPFFSARGVEMDVPAAQSADPPYTLKDGYYVRPVYFVASDETVADPDWEARLQTCWIFVQRFFADEMERNGFGRRNFNMETEANGKPRIYFYRGLNNLAHYEATHDYMKELEPIFGPKSLIVVMGRNAPWTGGRNPAPGARNGGAYVGDANANLPGTFEDDFLRYCGRTDEEQMALFRNETIPSNPLDPATNWTYGSISSARIGGTAHELGHAFGASHASVSAEFMSTGFYSFRTHFTTTSGPTICPGNALIFNLNAFFRSETSYADTENPTMEFDIPLTPAGRVIRHNITVSDAQSGLGFLGIAYGWVMYIPEDLRAVGNTMTKSYDLTIPATLTEGAYWGEAYVLDKSSLITAKSMPFRVVSSMPAVPPAAVVDPNETVYLDDDLVPVNSDTVGPNMSEGSGGMWCWNKTFKASGARGVAHPAIPGKTTELYLFSAPKSLSVKTGDLLTAYVYIDPANKPETIAIGWFKNTWGWTTYAYWGADKLTMWDGSQPSRVRMGDLPATGGWVRLAVPASAVGMEGLAIGGYDIFVVGSGNVFWDRFGKVSRIDDANLVSAGVSASVSGTNVTVTDSVRNAGTQAVSAPFNVRYYLSSDSVITPSDALLGERTVNGLDADEVSTATATFPVPDGVASGTYFVGAIADAGFQILETCETDNAAASSAIAINVSKPDLAFTVFSAKVTTAGKVSISNTVKNLGTAATAGTFAISFYLSADASFSPSTDVLLGSRARTTALAAGSGTSDTTAFAMPASAAPGAYYVFGVADSGGTQAESNEGNNVSAASGPLSLKPDLIVSALSWTKSGTTLTVSSTAKNEGPVATSGSFRIDFYLSTDATITTGDRLIGSRIVSASLACGSTNAAKTAITIPATVPAGAYRVGAIVDAGSAVSEVLETNNAKTASGTVTVGP